MLCCASLGAFRRERRLQYSWDVANVETCERSGRRFYSTVAESVPLVFRRGAETLPSCCGVELVGQTKYLAKVTLITGATGQDGAYLVFAAAPRLNRAAQRLSAAPDWRGVLEMTGPSQRQSGTPDPLEPIMAMLLRALDDRRDIQPRGPARLPQARLEHLPGSRSFSAGADPT
jgi:hypothetical protein